MSAQTLAFVSIASIAAAVVSMEQVQPQIAVLKNTDKAASGTIAAAVKQVAFDEQGNLRETSAILQMLCIPSTVGRFRRMQDMIASRQVDWAVSFANTKDDPMTNADAEKGTSDNRTAAYNAVKNARKNLKKRMEKAAADAAAALQAAEDAKQAAIEQEIKAAAEAAAALQAAEAAAAAADEEARKQAAIDAVMTELESLRLQVATLQADNAALQQEVAVLKASKSKKPVTA